MIATGVRHPRAQATTADATSRAQMGWPAFLVDAHALATSVIGNSAWPGATDVSSIQSATPTPGFPSICSRTLARSSGDADFQACMGASGSRARTGPIVPSMRSKASRRTAGRIISSMSRCDQLEDLSRVPRRRRAAECARDRGQDNPQVQYRRRAAGRRVCTSPVMWARISLMSATG